MTTHPRKLPPMASTPVGPAVRPGASLTPPPWDAPGTPQVPASLPPRREAGTSGLHIQCVLSAGQLLIAGRMPEDQGPGSVEGHLREYLKPVRKGGMGLDLAYHAWRQHARKAREGWPDWAITGDGGAMVRELKRQDKNPTPIQERWLLSLRAAGWDADVWKPCCILSGRVARELAVIAHIGGTR